MMTAEWTGKYPNLCRGKWILKDGSRNISSIIPDDLLHNEMGTYKTFEKWEFDDKWNEEWSTYEDGLECEDWIEANYEWLSVYTQDSKTMRDIYDAFNKNDWRHGSCGGCI